MASPPFIEDIYGREFHDLNPVKQEEMFALSCIDLGHWEAGPDWDITDEEVSQRLQEIVEGMLEGGKWRRFKSEGGPEWLDEERYHGDMTNRLLAEFVSEEINYQVNYERKGGGATFDVEMLDQSIHICDIGIKRMATTRQVCDEIETHVDKCKEKSSARNTLLLNYLPVTLESGQRPNDYLYGYVYLAEKAYSFFTGSSNFVSYIPAPINPDQDGQHPLRNTAMIIRDEMGIPKRT